VPVLGFAREVLGPAEVAVGGAIAVAMEDPNSQDGAIIVVDVVVAILVGGQPEDGSGVIAAVVSTSFSVMPTIMSIDRSLEYGGGDPPSVRGHDDDVEFVRNGRR